MIRLRSFARLGASSALALLASLGAMAQASASYQNGEHAINSGGNPAPAIASSNYKVTLSSIGDGLLANAMSSPSYGVSGGFTAAYPAPGEVLDLLFTGAAAFSWDPEPSVGSYTVYRGTLAGLPGGNYGECLSHGLTTPQGSDAETPASGQCFVYLVSAVNRLNEEGTLGDKSDGTPRPRPAPCP